MNYKILFIAVFLGISFLVHGQKSGTGISVHSRARMVAETFLKSRLGIDSGMVDLREYNKFKELFDINATVQDDNNPVFEYKPKERTGFYANKSIQKPFDLYAHNIALQVSDIELDSLGNLVAEDTTDTRQMTYSVYRRTRVQKSRKYVVQPDYIDQVFNGRKIFFKDPKDSLAARESLRSRIADTATYLFTSSAILTISLELQPDGQVKITGIKARDSKIACNNDTDGDAVLYRDDSLRNAAGDFTAHGMPDFDLDGTPDGGKGISSQIADKCKEVFGKTANKGCPMDYFLNENVIEGYVGLQLNDAKLNLPELNQLGYQNAAGGDATDVLQSKKGNIKNPGWVTGISAAVSYTYYFGESGIRKKNTGISFGVAYSGFSADYQLSEPTVYTFKSSDGVNDYRRRVTIDSLRERIKYNIFNFPVMFSYRKYIFNNDKPDDKKNKSVLNIKAGPSLMLFNTISEYNAFISFEGLYQTDDNGVVYNPLFDVKSSYNVYFTADSLQKRNPNRSAEEVFRELNNANKGYDFADSKNFRGKQKNDPRLTVGFNLAVDFQHKISDLWSLRAGFHGVFAALPGNKDKYKPIDKTNDPYLSVYNSNAKSTYAAMGASVGLCYKF